MSLKTGVLRGSLMHVIISAGVLFGAADAIPADQVSPSLLFYVPNSPPQGGVTGDRKGFMDELALEAARRAGYRASTDVRPWPRVLREVKEGKDLLIAGLSRYPSREASYTWVFPVFTLWRTFVTTGPTISTYAEGRSALRLVATHYGSLEITMLRSEGFGETQIYEITNTTPELDLLIRGRVDALYRPISEIRWLARGRPDAGRLVYGEPMQPTEQYIACSRDCSPEIVARLRQALQSMKEDGTIERLVKAYE